MNLNKLAKKITLKEAGEIEVSIAQVKEIMKDLFEELAKLKASKVMEIIERY